MQHPNVARHAAAAARYVHPGSRARERRLGLHAASAFTAAPNHRTVLRRPDAGPLTALRAPWRALVVAPPRPAAAMTWTGSGRTGGPRRTSLAPAWRA